MLHRFTLPASSTRLQSATLLRLLTRSACCPAAYAPAVAVVLPDLGVPLDLLAANVAFSLSISVASSLPLESRLKPGWTSSQAAVWSVICQKLPFALAENSCALRMFKVIQVDADPRRAKSFIASAKRWRVSSRLCAANFSIKALASDSGAVQSCPGRGQFTRLTSPRAVCSAFEAQRLRLGLRVH